MLRRSEDGGRTWTRARTVQPGWGRTIDNPTLLVDPATASLHLFFHQGYRRLWQRISSDGGRTFGPRSEVTDAVRAAPGARFPIAGMAPGPGAGAVLASGRLVVPVWISSRFGRGDSDVTTIVSDDHGATWVPGEVIAPGHLTGTSEAAIAALPSGAALLSLRQRAVPNRVLVRSADGAAGWSDPREAAELTETVCHAGLAALPGGSLAVVNPDGPGRTRVTVRWSDDEGASWRDPVVLDPGPSGYAALAPAGPDAVHVLWEHGRRRRTRFWPTTLRYALVHRESTSPT